MFLSTELPSTSVTTIEIESKIKWMGRVVGWCGPVLGLGILLSWGVGHGGKLSSLEDILGFAVLLLPCMVSIWWLGPWVAKSVQKEKWYHNLWKGTLTAMLSLLTGVIFIAGVVLIKEVSTHAGSSGAIGDTLMGLGIIFAFGAVPAILASFVCLLVLHIGIKRIYATSGVVSNANQD